MRRYIRIAPLVTAFAIAFPVHSALAATLCVNPGGTGGCFTTITAAVAAAAAHDTIRVAHGTYTEDVAIGKAISIVGENAVNTVIDATGLPNGINIDGLHNAGLGDVVVTGFTVANAMFEGILITNAVNVTVANNRVTGNNANLAFPDCPGILPPDTPQGEGFDCGEGIHLIGVFYSIVSLNSVTHNAGGILLSDETGPTHDNLISSNTVVDNVFDCGVTLASHRPVAPNGVYHNTIAGNEVSRNGTVGQGAGVGLFAPIPGTATYGNVVIGNRAVGNGIPGVAMHSHAPNQNLDANMIVGNYIAANGADDDANTPGTTGIVVLGVSPIKGTIISQNVIRREEIALAVKTPFFVNAHLNDFENHNVGVANLNGAPVDARENWWGCSQGPASPGCSTIEGAAISVTPWLTRPVQP